MHGKITIRRLDHWPARALAFLYTGRERSGWTPVSEGMAAPDVMNCDAIHKEFIQFVTRLFLNKLIFCYPWVYFIMGTIWELNFKLLTDISRTEYWRRQACH